MRKVKVVKVGFNILYDPDGMQVHFLPVLSKKKRLIFSKSSEYCSIANSPALLYKLPESFKANFYLFGQVRKVKDEAHDCT